MFSSRKTSAPSSGIITKSLRFRANASAYLNRTFSTPTSSLKWTWSGWVKRGTLGVDQALFGTTTSVPQNFGQLKFDATDHLTYTDYTTSIVGQRTTNAIYRDSSAWYHIVFVYDSGNATAGNRILLYVNGVQVTSFSASTDPTLNSASFWNNTSYNPMNIGRLVFSGAASNQFDGYMADVYFVDGQALTPTSFGAFSATTGVWQPIKYTGTYGTNGFHLPFTNTSSTAALGNDTSGNGNTWTVNNISLTAGSTYDSMNDVPMLTSATASNYAVLNPLLTASNYSTPVLSNGNLTALFSYPTNSNIAASISISSNKYYWELTWTYEGHGILVGIDSNIYFTGGNQASGGLSTGYGYYNGTGNKYNNNTATSYGSAWFTTGNTYVIGVAFDATNGTLAFYLNGASQGTAFTGIPAGAYFPTSAYGSGSGSSSIFLNFGQQPFTYTPPSGYVALNTYNLSTPTIAQGNKYMDATLYTGNTTGQTVTNAGGFQPDFFWLKARSAAYDNGLIDTNRGTTYYSISNSSAAESSGSTLTANSNGFSLVGGFNNGSTTYVAWQWQAGQGSNVSNTNGSITSTVSASTTAGFSIVKYTGTGANATVGHGLGVAPSMVIVKVRSTTNYWLVYHIGLTSAGYYIVINSTNGQTADSTIWNSTAPTSSVFSIGTDTSTNLNTGTFVAYCFAPIAGFSAFGKYTGNGSATGPFIYTGFQPKFVLIKRTDVASDWYIWDSVRNTFNTVTNTLLADTAGAETSASSINVLSNGFQCVSATVVNVSTGTYIYAAFASNPFKYSNAF